jgi:hypothetical protein
MDATTPTEVTLTGAPSATALRWFTWLMALVWVAGIVAMIVTAVEWWGTALLVLGGLLTLFVMWGMGAAVERDARETAALTASGTLVPADVVAAEDISVDSVVYELTLRVTPPDGVGFDVTHRCGHHVCATAAKRLPTTLTALVDPTDNTWAVVHRTP